MGASAGTGPGEPGECLGERQRLARPRSTVRAPRTASSAVPSTHATSARPLDDAVHVSTSWRTASSTASSSRRSTGRARPCDLASNDDRGRRGRVRRHRRRCTWRAGTPAPTARADRAGRTRSAGRRRRTARWARRAGRARERRRRPRESAAAVGRSSAHVWCWAITSVSGPIVNSPASVGDHRRRPLRRGDEGEAVLGERGGRPQLPAGGHGGAAPVADRPQAVPVACRGAVVDEPHEGVEIGALDQGVEGFVVAFTRAARGSRGCAARRGTSPSRRAAAPGRRSPRSRRRSSSPASSADASTAPLHGPAQLRRQRFAGELPDHGAQLVVGGEAQPVVDRPHVVAAVAAVDLQQAVPALAVGVVGDGVEHGDRPQLIVEVGALGVQREVVLAEVGVDEPLQ